MPVYALTDTLLFPPADHADVSGLLAVGGDLRPERLVLAYTEGIFPWYSEGQPILWHSPDPRMILWGPDLHVSRSLKKLIRQGRYEVRFDSDFDAVIRACSKVPRPDQEGTWITEDMIQAYIQLHGEGLAHSVEAYDEGVLVGGLYGVSLGHAFFGESMFAHVSNASKVALVTLVDCQVHTEHLQRFGASPWPRRRFLEALRIALEGETRRGTWEPELAVEALAANGLSKS